MSVCAAFTDFEAKAAGGLTACVVGPLMPAFAAAMWLNLFVPEKCCMQSNGVNES